MSKVVKLTIYKVKQKGNWRLRFSETDMGSILLIAQSILAPENVFVKYFCEQKEASSFVDFLETHDFWNPEIDQPW